MAFTDDDRKKLDRMDKSIAIVEANVEYIKPKVDSNTKFRFIASGVAAFVLTVVLPIVIAWYNKRG